MNEWTDFLTAVKDAESELGNPPEVWFRGQSDWSWGLTPSLLRQNNWQSKEKELFIEFKKTASRLFEKRNSEWEILFDMQHYWVPTRLLDWTTVLGVAIAFIIFDDQTDTDSALYVLDPIELNRLSGREEIVDIPENKKFNYTEIYLENRPFKAEKPIAIRPGFQTARIQAQKGVFTVHGQDENGLDTTAKDCVRKVRLPKDAKDEAKQFLKWANLDEYTIYPDIVGMSRHIKRKIFE